MTNVFPYRYGWLLLKPGPGLWTRTLGPGPGPRSWTPTLKNLDPEKTGINIGSKNMSDFRELFYEDHTQCELFFKSSCTNRYLN